MGGMNLLYFGFTIVLVNSGLSSAAAQKGRKIEFSTAPVDSENIQYNDDPEPLAGTQEYYESLSWITVTSDGYEQEESAFADIMSYDEYDEDNEEELNDDNDEDDDDDNDEPIFSKPSNAKKFDDSPDPTNVPHESDENYEWKDTEEFETFDQADQKLIDNIENDREKRKVFGRDNRIRVNPVTFPYTAIGKVGSGCTGTFIARRTILTAGHCVHSGKSGTWYKNLNFGRSKRCDPNRGIIHTWKRAFVFKGWSRYSRRKYDLAVILVYTPSPVFVSFKTSNRFRSGTLHIAGYPGESCKGGCMYRSWCTISTRRRGSRRKLMKYRCDTTPGMSGSAIIKYYWRRPVIQGVHSYGGIFKNGGPQITSKYAQKIRGWINGWGGN